MPNSIKTTQQLLQEINDAIVSQSNSYLKLESKIDSLSNNSQNKPFETTLNNIESSQCIILCQIWALLISIFSFITFSYYSIYTIYVKTQLNSIISKGTKGLTEKTITDSTVNDSHFYIIAVIILSISFLIILIWLVLRLNLIRESLTNKFLALSTFAEIQPILQNTDRDMSYEYRAVIKRILDSLNNLIDNTHVEI